MTAAALQRLDSAIVEWTGYVADGGNNCQVRAVLDTLIVLREVIKPTKKRTCQSPNNSRRNKH